MTRTSSILLILALFAGSFEVIADEPRPEVPREWGNQGWQAALPHADPGVDEDGWAARQLALSREEPPPAPSVPSAPPVGPRRLSVLVPEPSAEPPVVAAVSTEPVASVPLSPVPAVPLMPSLPRPAVPASPARVAAVVFTQHSNPSPAAAATQGPNPSPAAVPTQGPNPPLAADERLAPLKDSSSPVPFDILDGKHETELTIIRGRSRLLRSTIELTRVFVVDPKICDIMQYSPTEVGFIAKGLGTTQVTLWFRDSDSNDRNPNLDTQPRSIVVHVVADVNARAPHLKQLEAELAKLFPNSKVRLRTFGQRIIVLGQARDVADAAEILNFIRGEQINAAGAWVSGPGQAERYGLRRERCAGGMAGDRCRPIVEDEVPLLYDNQNGWSDRIINMLKVPGVHQVMLRVKIAELDRTAARNFGVNFSATAEFRNGTLLLQSLLNASNSNSVIGNFSNNQLSFGISYLEQHGVVRLLSEPNLVTLSGKPANFIAGGEFAVPTVVGIGGARPSTTDFRAYGAIISFTPYLLDKDLIRLQDRPRIQPDRHRHLGRRHTGADHPHLDHHGRTAGRPDAGRRRLAGRVDEEHHGVRLALDRQAPGAAQRDP